MIGSESPEGKQSVLNTSLYPHVTFTTTAWSHKTFFAWLLLHLNRIEKVQLSDMGSYRCAVLTEEKEILSEEGSIQLEGEFIIDSIMSMKLILPFWVLWSSFNRPLLRTSSFLCGTSAHVCGGQRVPEPELCGPRPSRACLGHLAAGWRSPQLTDRPSRPVAFHTQPYRYCFHFHLSRRRYNYWLVETLHNAKNLQSNK